MIPAGNGINVKKVGPEFLAFGLQFMSHDVKKQRMVGRYHRLDRILIFQHPRQVSGDRNRVVVIEGRDRIIDVEILDPLIRLLLVNGQLCDGKKEAPDKGVLFAARDFDVFNPFGGAVLIDFALEGDRPGIGVDFEVKIRVTLQQRANSGIHFQFRQAGKEARLLAIVLQTIF